MTTTTIWLWTAFAILIAIAAIRRLLGRWRRPRPGSVELDDAAIARILEHGTLSTADDEPLDEGEISRAEEEFWEESWDEPEEYGR